MLTVDPSVMIKKGALVAGAALKMIELPSIANPSDGWLVPVLGF